MVTAQVPRGHAADPAQVQAVSVVVCAYTETRWKQTQAAVASVLSQSPPAAEVIVVIDHNAALAARARSHLPGVLVLESVGEPGLSNARNTGLRAAKHPATVFLDDDAEARPGWLAALIAPYQVAEVVGTGGSVHPRWPGRRPRWFPATFDWVVGCSYIGLPEYCGPVRNPIGANMSVRTAPAREVGAFDTAVGRVGRRPRGCEETELAIRLTRSMPGAQVYYVPTAAVDHHVASERTSFRYFLRRCWHEGKSKADVVRRAGASAGLRSERRHVAREIPAEMLRDLRSVGRGEFSGVARMAVAAAGLVATVGGYIAGRLVNLTPISSAHK